MRLLPQHPLNVTDHTVRRVWMFVVLLAVAVVVGMLVWMIQLSSENHDLAGKFESTAAERTELSKRLDKEEKDSAAAQEGLQALFEQVERLGGNPVVDPADPTAPPRALGPTNAQVRDAIKVVCAGDRSLCSPTRAQVTATLRAICGDCRGEDAEPPADGKDGKDGQDGQDAPAVTGAQIDAALARYCGEDGCRGPGPTDQQIDERIVAYCSSEGDPCRGEDATFTPSGMDCPEGERVNGVHLLADGSLTVSCAPLVGRE